MHPSVGLALAYLLGSIPAAHIAGKARGVDLRLHGSGNLGATNAWRVLGWKIGLAVYVFDTLKGFVPAFFLPRLLIGAAPSGEATGIELWAVAYGVAAIVGHVKPIFLGGRGGGKGVATAGGVFLGLAPLALVICFAVFAIVLVTTGFVSLGSLVAAVVLPIVLGVTRGLDSPLFVVSVLLAAFVFYTHRGNIGRLRRGEESRFGKRVAGTTGGGDST